MIDWIPKKTKPPVCKSRAAFVLEKMGLRRREPPANDFGESIGRNVRAVMCDAEILCAEPLASGEHPVSDDTIGFSITAGQCEGAFVFKVMRLSKTHDRMRQKRRKTN